MNEKKIIDKLCSQIFPDDVIKYHSRFYVDDNGYFFTVVEFQPCTLDKGTFLNVGLSYLFDKNDYFTFSYSSRIGNKFIKYENDEQFENDVKEYVLLANKLILEYRKFRDVSYAKKCVFKKLLLSNDSWKAYTKSMFYFLTGAEIRGKLYYLKFLKNPYFKNIIKEHNYPKNINKDYVINTIKEQRNFWRSKSSMKKMKYYDEYDK